MKSEFCFIRNLHGLRVGDFIYHVSVGSDARSVGRMADVARICADRGYYFERWRAEVDAIIDAASEKYRPCGCVTSRPFRSARITIYDLWRLIIDNGFYLYESNYQPTAFEMWLDFHDNPDFIQRQNKKKVIQGAQPSERKNLSPDELGEGEKFRFILWLILCLFLLDGVVSSIVAHL